MRDASRSIGIIGHRLESRTRTAGEEGKREGTHPISGGNLPKAQGESVRPGRRAAVVPGFEHPLSLDERVRTIGIGIPPLTRPVARTPLSRMLRQGSFAIIRYPCPGAARIVRRPRYSRRPSDPPMIDD